MEWYTWSTYNGFLLFCDLFKQGSSLNNYLIFCLSLIKYATGNLLLSNHAMAKKRKSVFREDNFTFMLCKSNLSIFLNTHFKKKVKILIFSLYIHFLLQNIRKTTEKCIKRVKLLKISIVIPAYFYSIFNFSSI